MARETKVGLLAGLAFIICFAIILANRGSQSSPQPQLSYRVDHGLSLQEAVRGAVPRPGTGATATEVSPPRSIAESAPLPIERGTTGMATPPAIQSGAEVIFPFQPTSAEDKPPRPGLTRSNPEPTDNASVMGSANEPILRNPGGPVDDLSLASRTDERQKRRRRLEEALNAQRRRASRPAAGSQAQVALDSRTPPNQPVTAKRLPGPDSTVTRPSGRSAQYVVKAGDTLYKIAGGQYGRRSAKVIDAIYQANRSVLSSPDLLCVGVELALPVVEGVAGPAGVSSRAGAPRSTKVAAATPKSKTSSQGLRWYQIKKHDRYVTIARKQLGDGSRWREIYELNKGKFPDPQLIRDGVRIKLPAARPARTGG